MNFSGKLYVLSVRGLFAETKIASGSMVISVNTKEATCMTADECRDYIRSLSGDVTIVTTDTAAILASGRDKNYGYSFLPDNCRKVYNLDYNERIPPLLEDVGVNKEKWLKIVNLVETELLPCLTDAIELRKAMKELHGASDQGQMDRESMGELNAFKFQMAVSSAHSNTTMIAANILAKITHLMRSHPAILSQLLIEDTYPFESDDTKFANSAATTYTFFSRSKFSLPKGIEFVKVDYYK